MQDDAAVNKAGEQVKTFVFKLKDTSFEGRCRAYNTLRDAEVLPKYHRKFRHEEQWQMTTGRGYFVVELPFSLGQKVCRELATGWQLGKKEEANNV